MGREDWGPRQYGELLTFGLSAVGIAHFARTRDLGRINPAEFTCKLVNMKNAVSSCLQNYFC